MRNLGRSFALFLLVGALLEVGPAMAADSPETRNLVELRDTVVNLLQALVERGVLTREQAESLIRDAQAKAAAEVAANAAKEKAQAEEEQGAVRVPYVPEIVKQEIRKEVVADLAPDIKQEVVKQVGSNDTLRSALPDWVRNLNWSGDIRVRTEGDLFGSGNAPFTYLDYNEINGKGGIAAASSSAYLDTTEDRDRLRLRARFGFDATLGDGFTAGLRLATGAGEIFISTNQTEGTYGQGYAIALDQGYVSWEGHPGSAAQSLSLTGGRFANPYLSTDLIWYPDLTFEGVEGKYAFNFAPADAARQELYLTAGAYPLSSFSPLDSTPSADTKWLLGGQLGADISTAHDARFRLGAAYYDYLHIAGQQNAYGSTLLNWTAPALVQKGNTLFDIANSSSSTASLWALASDFRIVDVTGVFEFPLTDRYLFGLTAEALKNIGFNSAEVSARTGYFVAARNRGYRGDFSFGTIGQGHFGDWRAAAGYRYLERDAVVDAFNDEDFHLGGTDTKGYTLFLDWWFNPHVWLQGKYMAGVAIDGPPLAIDVWQFDVNTRF